MTKDLGAGSAECVGIVREGSIATIIINRPERHNALTSEVRLALPQVLSRVAGDGVTRVIVFRGAGQAAFASGADLGELATMDEAGARAHYLEFEECLRAVETCPLPTIAMIQGYALGGGCELAAACDLRVASNQARFGMPISRIGHTLDLSNARRLIRLVGVGQAKALVMTDTLINAEEARSLGLVQWVVPPLALESFTRTLAETVAGKAPLSLRGTKRSMQWAAEHPVADPGEDIAQFAAPLFETEDFKEGVRAFLEKRRPVFNGR